MLKNFIKIRIKNICGIDFNENVNNFFFFETICRFIFTIQSVTMNKKFIYVDIRFEKEIEYEIREGDNTLVFI